MRRRSQEQIRKDPFEDEWLLVYQGFQAEQEGLREALCTLGNGYFATRGATPESKADDIHYPGTYFAGCYNRLKTDISDRTVENESMVNAPNWLTLRYKIEDGDWFDLRHAKIHNYTQELDLRNGMLHRNILFEDNSGRITCVHERRFVSMAEPELAGLEMTFVAENWSGKLQILSALDGRVANNGVARYRQLNNQHLEPIETKKIDDETIFLQVETTQSHIRIAEAARTRIFHGEEKISYVPQVNNESGYISQEFSVHLNEMDPVTVEKIVSLVNSRIRALSSVSVEADKKVRRAGNYETLLHKHRVRWEHLWRRCSITISNNKDITRILNLHIFHLLQTVSLNTIDIDAGVPARGLHGEAYHGHVFWDELFIFPFLNLRIPDITRSLLMYRYRRLPEAKWAAKQEGYQGAMYPWQSGSDGREETQSLHLNPISKRWLPDKSHR